MLTDEFEIRECVAEDAETLSLLGQATFLETFAGILEGRDILSHCFSAHSASVYRSWLQQDQSKLWVVHMRPGQAPIGYLLLGPAQIPVADLSSEDLEIKRIYLLHRFQGSGLGKRLLAAAVDHSKATKAKRLLLGVYANNAKAINFYQRCGFVQLGRRKFTVGANDYDDTIMCRTV